MNKFWWGKKSKDKWQEMQRHSLWQHKAVKSLLSGSLALALEVAPCWLMGAGTNLAERSLVPAVLWSDHSEATYGSESRPVKLPNEQNKNQVPCRVTGSSSRAHMSYKCKDSALSSLVFFGTKGGKIRTLEQTTGKWGRALATAQSHQHEEPGCGRE